MKNRAARRVKLPASLMFAAALAFPGALGVSGCEEKLTEIVLVVDTEMDLLAEIQRVDIEITGRSGTALARSFDLTDPATPPFPMTVGLVPGGSGSVNIRVTGESAAGTVVDLVRTGFSDGSSRMVRSVLTAACLGVVCSDAETCREGLCAPIDRPGTSLPRWPGSPPPRPDDGMTAIDGKSVWAGGWQSCATKGNTLYCWGPNEEGQLGNGHMRPTLTRLPVLDRRGQRRSVSMGNAHGCLCDGTGQAWCWGRNVEGQIGVGDVLPHPVPVPVPGLDNCVKIVAGGYHTCAVRAGGSVVCWGRNAEGQVGQSSSSTPVTTPRTVPMLSGVLEVAAGDRFTCALWANAVECWGDNNAGQLGDGTQTSRSSHQRVQGSTGWNALEVVAGRFFACARSGTGQINCWGENHDAIFPGPFGPNPTPKAIPRVDDAVQMAAGHHHLCILRRSGVMACWGSNQFGQLGDGSDLNATTPVELSSLRNVTTVATGMVHTCARHEGGLSCWGQNLIGQLGDGTQVTRAVPSAVVGF